MEIGILPINVDLKNWRGNQKNSGFLPEERAWMDQLFGPIGYVDAFRELTNKAINIPGGRIAGMHGLKM